MRQALEHEQAKDKRTSVNMARLLDVSPARSGLDLAHGVTYEVRV